MGNVIGFNWSFMWLSIANGYLMGYYMPLFFCLSGITFNSRRLFREYAWKRFNGLILKYFAYSLILLLIGILCHMVSLSDGSLYRALYGVLYSRYYNLDGSERLLVVNNSPLWFCTAMFTASFFFWFLQKYKANRKTLYLITIIYLLITVFLDLTGYYYPWSIDTALLSAIFMLVGYQIRDITWKRYHILLMLIVYTLTFAANDGTVNYSLGIMGSRGGASILLFAVSGISGSLFCIEVCKKFANAKFGKLLQWIGRNSLSIMCTHSVIYFFANKLMQQGEGLWFYAVDTLKWLSLLWFADV